MSDYKKRKDGRYLMQVQVGLTEQGKPKYKNIYARTINELKKKERDFRQELDKGIVVDDCGLTVEAWARRWLEFYKGHLQHNTIEMYRIMIEAHIIPAIGNLKLKQLKTHHVQELLNSKLKDGSTRTAEKIKLTLNQIVKQAIINEYIYKDIMLGVEIPKKTRQPRRALTDDEIAIIKAANLSLKEKAFVDMLLHTGLRRGEILALNRNDVNLAKKTVDVNKSVYEKDGQYILKATPKTQAGFRTIPLIDSTVELLSNYIAENKGFSFILFPSAKGNIMSISAFRRFWEGVIKKIEFEFNKNESLKTFNISEDITPHIFRHTYATKLYYAEIDIKTAQYLLGHSSIQVTMDVYTHLNNNSLDTASIKLNSFFKDDEESINNKNV